MIFFIDYRSPKSMIFILNFFLKDRPSKVKKSKILLIPGAVPHLTCC